ncbi:DNA methyltransferase [Thermoplasma sp. Kam2015]|uniref:DNA adenine methylase n=1 Tax=Thermoplasma sp. Kam2015 TaxID=2094122 RepID=UPI000D8F3EB0|nr:DNA adenine methylase [Thermoplasma sp. Kam2015]PYB67477.1 DNA methyltransferase [Thermoplasma sp. Kam2015]
MKPTVTPLRYPGGKTWILPYVERFLTFHNIKLGTIFEPFGGSASVSIGILKDGFADHAVICEKDPVIVAFWKSILFHNQEFIDAVRSLDISMETWYNFKKYLEEDAYTKYDTIEIGLAFLFYNRVNYSGIIKAGPIGGKRQISKYSLNCRFNVDRIIKKINDIGKFSDRITIREDDGIELIRKFNIEEYRDRSFFYIDPPYYNAGKVLYRNYFTDKEHKDLADAVVKLKVPWLVSYDDSNFIYNLYKNEMHDYIFTDYQAGNLKRGIRELLISNLKIPPLDTIRLERFDANNLEIANPSIISRE